jgi:hypothetical protein
MFIIDFIIKHPLCFDLILISIGIIAFLWCALDLYKLKREGTPYERALKQIEQERKENIKRQINRNLAARKRKDAIHDLIGYFDFRDIKVDVDSDKFYVVIKIHKGALVEREVK